jgi:hypothetical protein
MGQQMTTKTSMRRLPLTFTLTVLTALTLATGAIAAPEGPATADCPMADDPAMTAMHADCPMVGTGEGGAGPTGGHAPHHGTTRPHDGGPHHGESPSGPAPDQGMGGAHERHHR